MSPQPQTCHALPTNLKVSDQEWRTLMVGAVVVESSGDEDGTGGAGGGVRPKAASLPWLSPKAWDQLLAYEATLGASFAGLPDAVASESAAWKVVDYALLVVGVFVIDLGTGALEFTVWCWLVL